MVSPSYAHKSSDARKKHHLDDEFNDNLKNFEKDLDKWNHTLELVHVGLTILNTILIVYIISKLS